MVVCGGGALSAGKALCPLFSPLMRGPCSYWRKKTHGVLISFSRRCSVSSSATNCAISPSTFELRISEQLGASCCYCRWASASASRLPLVMLFLERIGIFQRDSFTLPNGGSRCWCAGDSVDGTSSARAAIRTACILMLAPLICLYFGGIALCKWLPKKRRGYAAGEKVDGFSPPLMGNATRKRWM